MVMVVDTREPRKQALNCSVSSSGAAIIYLLVDMLISASSNAHQGHPRSSSSRRIIEEQARISRVILAPPPHAMHNVYEHFRRRNIRISGSPRLIVNSDREGLKGVPFG